MHVAFLHTLPSPEGFEHLGLTVMTMFKLMLGLTDIEILYEARHPWLTVSNSVAYDMSLANFSKDSVYVLPCFCF